MKNSPVLTSKLSSFALLLSWLLVLTPVLLWFVDVGHASNFIDVNSLEDIKKSNDGLCTLREAIIAANSDKPSGGKPGECAAGSSTATDIIRLTLPGTYTLSRTDSGKEDAAQTGDLDITGDLDVIVEGHGATIDASGVTDRVLHILSGHVTITGVAIKDGGGIVTDGGGIYNGGALELTNVTVSGNVASARGGGIYNAGTLRLNNVTIANNSAVDGGGGIANDDGGTVYFQNTIIAGNGPNDCSGTLSSLGHNLDSDGSCVINGENNDITSATPLLGPLQNNGGGTLTHALLAGSPAIDAGDDATCKATDQRGEIRPLDGDDDGHAQCDVGAFEYRQNNFLLLQVFPNVDDTTTVRGLLNGTTNSTVNNLYFSHVGSCDAPGDQFGDQVQVMTDENGYFTAVVDDTVPDPADPANLGAPPVFLTATATDLDGNPLGFSNCASIGGNVAWPLALSLDYQLAASSTAIVEQFLDRLGQSRWYKLTIEPDSTAIVTLTGPPDENGDPTPLPANYDLTVYKDIGAAFAALQAPPDPQDQDLLRLDAEFAPESFSSDSFSPESFSPDSFSPESFSPENLSPESFSPESFSPESFSPESFSPESFSPESFSPESFSPESFSPESFSPESFSPESFSPESFSPESFSGAQTRSLLGVSAFDGTAGEGIRVNTWNNTGYFYVRVRGRNGVFNQHLPFHVQVKLLKGSCGQVGSDLPATSHMATAGDYKTIILIDLDRMVVAPEDMEAFQQLPDKLNALADAVDGIVVNVGTDDRVAAANAQADLFTDEVNNVICPYAKNLVAQAIKDIVDDYRELNPDLAYVVIVGDDNVIPFFRHPDNALLGPESQYFPPVRDNTASQASLRKNYVLSQDAYGSKLDISLNNSTYPVPELAVGRLVETATEISTVIEVYLSLGDGVVAPSNALAAGYDFLADAAKAIRDEFKAGLACTDCVDELIDDRDVAPENGWMADQLRQKLLEPERLDLAFLAGHFSASGALAADYSTRLVTADLVASTVNLENAIIFSAGCHAGYNIVNQHGVPNVTDEPDWAQAFARKGATLVAGTGYQYGDTDFLEYSERIYLEFSRQLRVGSGPVPIGMALNEAKRVYLAQTPVIRGLHEKALLEATIFGLPMLKVDLAGDYTPPTPTPETPTLKSFTSDPGKTLGLQYDDVTVTSPLIEHTVTLSNVVPNSAVPAVTASYLSGNAFGEDEGVVTNPAEPALPLELRNVTALDTVLRGVGFRGGKYQEKDVFPLIGAPTTELRGVHAPFVTDYFYPIQPWRVNYHDALYGGDTLLMVTPAQHKISEDLTDPQLSTRRQFSEMTFRLYYSDNFETYAGGTEPSTPALAAAPAIIHVSAVSVPDSDMVNVSARVVGNPAAGIQEVWATYTDVGDPCPAGGNAFCMWESLVLTQNSLDSTLWTGEIGLSANDITAAANLRLVFQAVNGVGLVNRADNMGRFFTPGVDAEPTLQTQLEFQSPPTEEPFGTKATFSAKLTQTTDENGNPLPEPLPLANQKVNFRLGPVSRLAVTGPDGVATVELALLAMPGAYEVNALFGGTSDFIASLATTDFAILKQDTDLSLDPSSASVPPGAEDTGIVATLTDATGRALREKTVFFVVSDGVVSHNVHDITDLFGRVPLGSVPLGAGIYDVTAYFGGDGVDETLELVIEDETVTLDLEDPSYNTSSATGSLTINIPPVAVDDLASTDEDTPISSINVLDNDEDVDGDPLAVAGYDDSGTSGLVTLNPDGTFDYDPNGQFDYLAAGETATDSFTYTISDGNGGTDTATVTIVILGLNDAPTDIYLDNASVAENQPSGTVVGTFSTTDPDASDSHIYSFVDGDNDNDSFTIEGSTLKTAAVFDFETKDTYTIQVRTDDGNGGTFDKSFTITVIDTNEPPICSGATAGPQTIWPPDKEFWPVTVRDVTDPNGDLITIAIDQIFQDEPVGKGKSFPDGQGVGTDTAWIRAERDGKGNGRIYHIKFTADDGQGGSCTGEVLAGIVPHDQGGDLTAIDDGPPWYDSMTGAQVY